MAEGANDLTGGSAHKGGMLDMYPEDLRAIFDYPFGAERRLVQNTAGAVSNAAEGKPTDYAHLPLSRVIMGTDYDQADKSRHFDRLREEKQPWTR